VAVTTTPVQAVESDGSSRFATYNMDGNNNGAAWQEQIRSLVQNNAVVALQEAGAGPPMPANPNRSNYRRIRLTPTRTAPLPSSVTQVTWPAGPNGSNRYVYFLQTDPQRIGGVNQDQWQGGRTNLAMVTDSPATEVRVLENPTYDPAPDAPNDRYRARPLLGLRFGNTWYWNTHARGEDVTRQDDRPGLIDQVRGVGDGRNWVLLGDFNLNIINRNDDQAHDQSLRLEDHETLVRTGQPTYINGRGDPSELDYAITRGLPGGFTATIPRGAGSDHVPVEFARTPILARPTRPAHAYPSVVATQDGDQLQENRDGSYTTAGAEYGDNQTYWMDVNGGLTNSLRNSVTGRCVSVASDARRDESSGVVAGSCDDERAQWRTSDVEDEEWHDDQGGAQRWQNVAFPELCLTPSGSSVTAAPCTQDDDQRWWNNPTDVPTDWQTAASNVRLESAFLDGRLRRRGNVPGTGIYAQPRPPGSWWIYWLLYERRDFGWNIQRISEIDNLVRIKSVDGDDMCLGVADEHAEEETEAVLRKCDDSRDVEGAGQRWLAESYADGSIRFRNEANHLCLLGPNGDSGKVTLYKCTDIAAVRWNVVNP
jgi:endonuclease/exonuclease/phosphatase family metal-dependent hydrolase